MKEELSKGSNDSVLLAIKRFLYLLKSECQDVVREGSMTLLLSQTGISILSDSILPDIPKSILGGYMSQLITNLKYTCLDIMNSPQDDLVISTSHFN